MARRSRPASEKLDELRSTLKRRMHDSPLVAIGDYLESLIHPVQAALLRAELGRDDSDRLAACIEAVLDRLPRSFGPRFRFDAGTISAISEEWSKGSVEISDMVIPCHLGKWGHQRIPLPAFGREAAPFVDLVLFPGKDDLLEANLLSYPFICHEMGHYVLFRRDETFVESFTADLNRFAGSLRLRAFADEESASKLAETEVEQILQFWGPSVDHHNWAHEIAVDVIALWTCGPAYLATIQDVLDDDRLNPYLLSQNHPPWEVRANALLYASDKLEWASSTGGIRRLLDAWRISTWNLNRTNQYLAFANLELTRACVDSALTASKTLALPLCTPGMVGKVASKIKADEEPDFGTELLLEAWLRWSHEDEKYVSWERDVVARLSESVRL